MGRVLKKLLDQDHPARLWIWKILTLKQDLVENQSADLDVHLGEH